MMNKQPNPYYGDPKMLLPLGDLDFTARTKICLRAENINFLGQILLRTESELLRVPNLGRKSINEIKEVIAHCGQYELGQIKERSMEGVHLNTQEGLHKFFGVNVAGVADTVSITLPYPAKYVGVLAKEFMDAVLASTQEVAQRKYEETLDTNISNILRQATADNAPVSAGNSDLEEGVRYNFTVPSKYNGVLTPNFELYAAYTIVPYLTELYGSALDLVVQAKLPEVLRNG